MDADPPPMDSDPPPGWTPDPTLTTLDSCKVGAICMDDKHCGVYGLCQYVGKSLRRYSTT
jgi:hypothetical protein